MDKSVNTVNDLRKCAKGHHINYLYRCNVANCVLSGEYVPRVSVLGLVSERDSLLLSVEALYEYCDLLTNRNNVCGSSDRTPGKLGLVNHTVNTAEINERAVSGEALNATRVYLALFDRSPECGFTSAALLASNELNRADSSIALDLDNAKLYLLALNGGKIAVLRNACLRCGNEHAVSSNENDNAASYDLNDLSFKDLTVLTSRNDLLPVLVRINALLGKLCNALDVAYADNEALDLVALLEHLGEFYRSIVCDLFSFDHACNVHAKVKLNFSVSNQCYGSGDSISCI